MIMTETPRGRQRNPYLAPAPQRARPDLRPVIIRMFLVIVPGQLAGYLVGGILAQATGAFAVAAGGFVVNLAAAVAAGILVGLATTPPPRQRAVCAAISVVLGTAVAAAVVCIAAARLAAGFTPGPLDVAPGVAVTAVGQGLAGWLCWRLKAGTRARAGSER